MDSSTGTSLPTSIDSCLELLHNGGYVAERSLATVLFLSMSMKRPLFLEGEAGVGKTEIAKVLADTLKRPLIRLQCYEGLDVNSAAYEWNYAAQMLEIRLADGNEDKATVRKSIFEDRFLIERPLLQSLRTKTNASPVLLIDELDRTDEAFEAYLLEILSDFQITVPELGTIKAKEAPLVIITSNRTREVHDALKRRCLYHWVDYPGVDRELDILRIKAPEASRKLTEEVVLFIQNLRTKDLFKKPGVAESIDWATALSRLDQQSLDPETINNTLGVILKYQDDITKIEGEEAGRILNDIRSAVS